MISNFAIRKGLPLGALIILFAGCEWRSSPPTDVIGPLVQEMILRLGISKTSNELSVVQIKIRHLHRNLYHFGCVVTGITDSSSVPNTNDIVRRVRVTRVEQAKAHASLDLVILRSEDQPNEEWRIYLTRQPVFEPFLKQGTAGFYIKYRGDAREALLLFSEKRCLVSGNNWEIGK
jgi:hypothetical protein